MKVTRRGLGALLLAGMLGLACAEVCPAYPKDKEAELLRKLAREQKPEKKAKYEIRLARLKLQQAMDAREQGDFEGTVKLLKAYSERISSAWHILRTSGRDARKKPSGFKELDIEIREDGRYLEDLRHTFSVMDREPVERVIQEVERIRAEVIKALFPTMARPAP